MRRCITYTVAVATVLVGVMVSGVTNVDSTFKYGWGENIGWTNWRDANGGADGVHHHGSFLSGYIWGENVGFINLGDGTPGGGNAYANVNGADFGVNVLGGGNLSGLGWGENIGWINFDTAAALGPFTQQARFDAAANRFRGYAWGENVGWINLDDATNYVGVLPAQIMQWRSVRTHGGGGGVERFIVLNATATGNGSGGPTVETRNGGIQKIELDFNQWVMLTGTPAAGINVTDGTNTYGPSSVTQVDNDTIAINFNPGVLGDQQCYTITISSGTVMEPIGGDLNCKIRALEGDTTMNGQVNDGDVLYTKTRVTQSSADHPQHDVNLSGGNIGVDDMQAIKPLITNPARQALCP